MWILLGVVLVVAGLWMIVITGAFPIFYSNPSSPAKTHYEFDFILVYEFNAQEVTVKDSIVCEYDGVKRLGTAGNKRKWKSYIKSSGSERIVLADIGALDYVNDFGEAITELVFDYGNAEFYMGDNGNGGVFPAQNLDYVSYLSVMADGNTRYNDIPAEEAYEKFGVRLISWECDPPIKNTFK